MYFENSERSPRKCVSHIMDIIMLFLDTQSDVNNLSPLTKADILKEMYLKNKKSFTCFKILFNKR